ncbi:helix-turn-helix domain-containing protein [Pseudomonas alloputida]|nr:MULTISPECIES: S24 family peptidase [Pseudomonas]MCE0864364.1 helix-turn-helix domain-containing protein [Pseudomonas alloputida]MCE0869233.1 helix-turn-helix domain-containing protein [Pseudomonas alloputida]MCE0893279.1 helix-turn-helix domain-containing protein [Pseudomonas alloputida]MCE0922588.1 helix-turn-helix domain-containing protein [Pseudomonas alloputida]MCE1048903.1 helix-turn-helix domain-containing protein [Pseudomonas alloputida]
MKKRTLTPEELAECQALKAVYLASKSNHGLSQMSLAEKLGITQSAVSMYMNGVNALNLPIALGFAKALNVSVEDFSPRLAKELGDALPNAAGPSQLGVETTQPRKGDDMELLGSLSAWEDGDPVDSDEVEVPYFAEVEFAGGNGMTEVAEIAGRQLRFSKDTLRAAGVNSNSAAVARIKGSSMERLILDGAAIGFDMSDTLIYDGDIYAFNHGGMLRVKYLYRLPHGAVRISSENSHEYPDEIMSAEDWQREVKMLGRVFWWSTVRRSRRR